MIPLDQLQRSDFNSHLHEIFSVHLEGSDPIELELVSATGLGSGSRPGSREPFSLQFLGPGSSQYLPQHIYRLEHPEMGGLEIFLVPLGPEAGRMRYEAIFS